MVSGLESGMRGIIVVESVIQACVMSPVNPLGGLPTVSFS